MPSCIIQWREVVNNVKLIESLAAKMKSNVTKILCGIAMAISAVLAHAQERPPVPTPPIKDVIHEARSGLKVEVPIGWEVVQDEPTRLRMNLVPQEGTYVLVETGPRAQPAVLANRLAKLAERAKKYATAGRLRSWEELELGGARVIFTVESDADKSRKNCRIVCRGHTGKREITITGSTYTGNFRLVHGLLEQVIRSMRW
jgi:hypothetical protein